MKSLVLPATPLEGAIVPSDPRLDFSISGPQWAQFIGLVANGQDVVTAATQAAINPLLLEGVLRTVPERYQELKDAKTASARREWDYETVCAICDKIATNGNVRKVCEASGKDPRQFLYLATHDPVVKDLYDTARLLRAELWNDEVLHIVDDEGSDMTFDGKPNVAAVRRSALRAETRMKFMEYANEKKYGAGRGKTDVTVNVNVNAVERLEAAQKRLRQRSTLAPPVVIEQQPQTPPTQPPPAVKPSEGWLE